MCARRNRAPLGLGARAHDRCCPRGLAGPDRRPARRAATAVAAASSTDCSRSTRSSKCLSIMWLRTGRVGVKGALAQVAKYERLVEVQAGHVDLSSLPPSRRRQLAAQARRQPHRGHRQRRRAPLVHARALSRDVQPHPGVLAAPADLPLLTQSGLATTTPRRSKRARGSQRTTPTDRSPCQLTILERAYRPSPPAERGSPLWRQPVVSDVTYAPAIWSYR